MIKKILLIFLFISFLHSSNNKQKIVKINFILDRLANNIIKEEMKLKSIIKKEREIENKLYQLNSQLYSSGNKIENLKEIEIELKKKKEYIEEEILNYLSNNYYLDNRKFSTLDDIIYKEVEKEILKQYSKTIKELFTKHNDIKNKLLNISQQIRDIETRKNKLLEIKKELQKIKKQKIVQINKLKKQKNQYKLKLLSLIKKQKEIRKQLEQLNIVKDTVPIAKDIHVKKFGSIYMKTQTANYYGNKTIPPVRGKIVKKFGTYIDPIYNIKIYNESITLKTRKNAIVRSIFNGKIVFVGKKEGKYIVVIKHKNNLFSIYSNLYMLSPIIKKSNTIKKGAAIGRVEQFLEFEVTYKDKAINPLKVIKLSW